MTTAQQMIRAFGVSGMGSAGSWCHLASNTVNRGDHTGYAIGRWARFLMCAHPRGHQYFYYKQY